MHRTRDKMTQYSKESERYIENAIKTGTSLNQAIAQEEVLRYEYDFRETMKRHLTGSEIESIIRQVIREK